MAESNAARGGAEGTSDRELVVTRVFDAPRTLVFAAWTEPEHVARWWGPRGFSNRVSEMDVRPGGVWRVVMTGPDGVEYPNRVLYREVVEPERLVYEHGDEGPDAAPPFHVTVTFEEKGSGTEVTMRAVFASAEIFRDLVEKFGIVEGSNEMMDRLAEHTITEDAAARGRAFAITRVLDAPRDVVFRAWTDAEQLAKWWGPAGFTWVSGTLDLRPGGRFHYHMKSPGGDSMWGKFSYRDVVAPERIVFTNAFSDETGATVPAPFPIDFPLEILNTLTLEARDAFTILTLRGTPVDATAAQIATYEDLFPSMRQGFGGTFGQLEDYLDESSGTSVADREIVATRDFDAPRDLVWAMWTEPEHLARWWGPEGFTNTISTMDVRTGGAWEFVMHGPDGKDYRNASVYLEVARPERLVYDHVSGPKFLATVDFSEVGAGTAVRVRMRFDSAALRDRVAEQFGAVQGLQQTLDRLDAELAAARR